MFENANPYTLRKELVEGLACYFVSFTDGQGILRETEVSRLVYMEFLHFVRVERNLKRQDERNVERFELSDETLYNRAMCPQAGVEDTVLGKMRDEHLRLAIQRLPDLQRRRFTLYYDFGLTYEQIARLEGCSLVAVKYTIDKAKVSIIKEIKNFTK